MCIGVDVVVEVCVQVVDVFFGIVWGDIGLCWIEFECGVGQQVGIRNCYCVWEFVVVIFVVDEQIVWVGVYFLVDLVVVEGFFGVVIMQGQV